MVLIVIVIISSFVAGFINIQQHGRAGRRVSTCIVLLYVKLILIHVGGPCEAHGRTFELLKTLFRLPFGQFLAIVAIVGPPT